MHPCCGYKFKLVLTISNWFDFCILCYRLQLIWDKGNIKMWFELFMNQHHANCLFRTKSIVVAILVERSVSFWHGCSLARQDFLSTTTFVKDLQPLAIPWTIALFLMSSQGAYSIKYWIKAAWFSQRTDSPYRSLPPDVWHVTSCWVWQKVSEVYRLQGNSSKLKIVMFPIEMLLFRGNNEWAKKLTRCTD